MEEIQLDVQVRVESGTRKVKEMRRQGQVPAVVYGGDKEPTLIKFERGVYDKIMRQHRGESVVFHLNVKDGEKKLRDYATIVKEEQHHPVMDTLIHVDFQRISLDVEIEVSVPVEAIGEAIGVKRDKGSLDHVLWSLDIVCLPTVIPQKIEVDVSALEIGDAIHVKDIVLPAGVKANQDADAIVITVVPPMREEEEVVQAEEPEVLKEKKPKDEA